MAVSGRAERVSAHSPCDDAEACVAERGSLALIDSADNAARIDSLMCVDEKARWEAKKKGSISFAGHVA